MDIREILIAYSDLRLECQILKAQLQKQLESKKEEKK